MQTNQSQKSDTNSPPVHTACAGSIRASVWESEDKQYGIRHKILVTRMFKENGVWLRGKTFYADELAALIESLAKAQRWVNYRRRQLGLPQQSAP